MSSKNTGLRRAGIVGLSTLVATSMMSGLAITASALPPAYTALTTSGVTQGAADQSAGSLTLDIQNNAIVTNSSQTFTVSGNDCTTAGGIAAATEFAAVPTAVLTGPFVSGGGTAGTAPVPVFTTTLGSSTPACVTAGITDKVTLAIALPGSATGPTDWFKYTLSNVKYNVGATAPLAAVAVASAGTFTATPGSVTNATVTDNSYSFGPFVAAQESSVGNLLGTATYVESAVGALFKAGVNTVTLTLNNGATFTGGVTPVVTVPAGYTAVAAATAGGSASYSFTVTGATLSKATVSISGLKADVGAVPVVVSVASSVTQPGPVVVNQSTTEAVNVLDFAKRTGGATRYETAATLFTNEFGAGNTRVVLATGELYPDALSANYLAGRLNTGTLLTTPTTLSPAARLAILNANVATVYITGGTGAVSQNVENQIEALHVGNVPAAATIIVVRLGGTDRYATNKLVNENSFRTSNTVLMAAGNNFPDALALGPVAYRGNNSGVALADGYPLILTKGSTLGTTENSQLSDFNPANVIIAGGTAVVSQAIQDNLVSRGFNVTRLAGADRTLTAAAVATWATLAAQGFVSSTTYIARGDNFADALAAGPVAGNNNRLIVLSSSPTLLGAGIPSYLATKDVGAVVNNLQVGTLHALGLTGAVSTGLTKEAAATIGK